MAERRMISKSLLMDNDFLGLSNDSKALYLYLLMFADDDGIVKRSMMIDSVLHVDDSNYQSLENNNLIIPYDNQLKVITNWNNLQTIRSDIYKQTSYLEVRSQLFMKVDYSYTKNADDKTVFSSADNWVKNGRPKDIKDFKPLINSFLQHRNGIRNDDRNGVRNLSKVKDSIDKNRLDKSRLEQTREDQNSTDQKNLNKCVYTTTSSSNGGMGETTSYRPTESNKQSNNQSDNPEILITKINQTMNTSIPHNDKRLNALFSDLLNQYKLKYVTRGLAKLLTDIQDLKGQANDNTIKRMIAAHLPENVKAVTTERTE